MKVTVAENAGFCFGVKRATDRLQEALTQARPGERICTLGHLIHNESYNALLERQGVSAVSEAELAPLARAACAEHPVTVLVRAHGCPRQTQELLEACAASNPHFRWLDCTCPYVKKIHHIAQENSGPDRVFLLIGARTHPEVVGIMSYFEGEKYVFSGPEELEQAILTNRTVKIDKKTPVMAAQTTLNLVNWHQSQKILGKLCTNAVIFDTICSVTEMRQNEALRLSRACDFIVVIGGRESSNTAKLYDICRRNCERTVWIAQAAELDSSLLSGAQNIGIVAGASTPRNEIQEVYKTMIENENFEQLLDENKCPTINTGDVVTGTVTQVSDAELQLDLGTSVTGYIKAEQISNDPTYRLTEHFQKGDQVEAFVIRVSDVEGVAELSKKRVDSDRNWQNIVQACEEKTVLEGRVAEAVKGGLVVYSGANRVFIPASQSGVPKDGDLSALVGTTVSYRVIEVKNGKKAIGSIRAVLRDQRRAREAEFWANIEVGKVYQGVVKSLTSYGAFVDLGGIDGMIHISELSWDRIKHPSEVVNVGDTVSVYIKGLDREKGKISLGYKRQEDNPWEVLRRDYPVGSVVDATVVGMTTFGAFARIIPGIDGLIHISQIADHRIEKPQDVLKIGDVVKVKITEIDFEKKRVSLSIRALLEEQANGSEEAPVEE